MLLTQQPRAQLPAFPKILRVKIINVAQATKWRRLEESELWLENVDRTHLVLTSGKLVRHKSIKLHLLMLHLFPHSWSLIARD